MAPYPVANPPAAVLQAVSGDIARDYLGTGGGVQGHPPSFASRPEARERPSVRSLSSQAVLVAVLKAKPVSNCVRCEALTRSSI